MKWKIQLALLKPWWNFTSFYRDDILAYIGNSIVALLSFIMRYEISWRFNELKFQSGLIISI